MIETAPRITQLQALPFVVALSWIFAELRYRFVYTPAQKLKPWITPQRRTNDVAPARAAEAANQAVN